MPDRSDVIYIYDGSFDGLMCCVFESYAAHELPADITPINAAVPTLFDTKYIETIPGNANRVLNSIPKKMGSRAAGFIQQSFLTCLPQKELRILDFMRLGYDCGSRVMGMAAHADVNILSKAVNHMTREAHLLKGFVRFSERGSVLAAQIEPKNIVLPLIADHFCERFPEERFVIYDITNKMALTYQPYRGEIIHAESFVMPKDNESTEDYERLWRVFYDSIEVEGRKNEKCRMNHMPKRYWKHLTEMQREGDSLKMKDESLKIESKSFKTEGESLKNLSFPTPKASMPYIRTN